jgi:dsDNA-specific endonuclease/ATPase MutS2
LFLTLARIHHGEVKTLKYSDPRFENASVEFSEEKVRPTYKLLCGIPGRSNALNIAERLGIPKDILIVARSLYGFASAQLSEVTWLLML